MHAIMTGDGKITIPQSIRDELGLSDDTVLDFEIVDGKIQMKPVTRSIRDLFGLLKRPGQPTVTVEEMNEAIREEACRQFHASVSTDDEPPATPGHAR